MVPVAFRLEVIMVTWSPSPFKLNHSAALLARGYSTGGRRIVRCSAESERAAVPQCRGETPELPREGSPRHG
eukprot:752491-Hanusia_phi.AAC.1